MAKTEVGTFHHPPGIQPIPDDPQKKILRPELKEVQGGFQNDHVIDPLVLEQFGPVLYGGQNRLELFRPKQLEGVRVKGDSTGRPAGASGSLQETRQQSQVAVMDPVEIANAENSAPAGGRRLSVKTKTMEGHGVSRENSFPGYHAKGPVSCPAALLSPQENGP